MKLYLISQTENNRSDTYDSAVVCAADEDAARNIQPGDDWGAKYLTWCSGPEKVAVRYIGEAAPDLSPGVVLASFNAG